MAYGKVPYVHPYLSFHLFNLNIMFTKHPVYTNCILKTKRTHNHIVFCRDILPFPLYSSLAWLLMCKVMATMNRQVLQGYLHTSFPAAFRF